MTLGVYGGAGSGITKILWHLEGNSNDSSGNANNGSDTSITYGLGSGRFGQGAQSNAATDEITKATNLGIGGTGAITVSRWIQLTGEIGASTWCLWSHRSTLTADRYFQLNYEYNAGTRRLNLQASGNPTVAYTITLGTTNWYNIVGTRASGASPAVALYVNGNSVGTGTGGTGTTGSDYFALCLAVASQAPNANHDEVIVENVVWSASQVRKYYTFAKGRFGIV